jgi:hypothetical protein
MIIFYGLGILALALKLFMFELIIFITPKPGAFMTLKGALVGRKFLRYFLNKFLAVFFLLHSTKVESSNNLHFYVPRP